MEIRFNNYELKENLLTFSLEEGNIIGLTGQDLNNFIEIITLKTLNKGQLTINNIKVTKDNIRDYRKKIVIINKRIKSCQNNVLNIMIDYIKRHNLAIKSPIKKIADSLRIVELEENILKRNIVTLSLSEKIQLQLAISLLANPEVLILEEPFKCLDKQNEKKLIMLLQRLKEQFKKTIIVVSEDSNILYKYTNKIIIIKKNKILVQGNTNEEYLNINFLRKNKIEVPDIVEFTYLAKNKKSVKIDYHKDVRDIIKDIYKHI